MSPSAPDPVADGRVHVDSRRLWAGGAATMLVAGGVAIVGVLAIRALFSVSHLDQWGGGAFAGDPVSLVVAAAVATLVATGFLHLLMVSTPRAYQFFAWIASLVIAGIILRVLLSGAGVVDKFITSLLYLVIGTAITSLLSGVGHSAIRYERPVPYTRSRS